MPGRVSFVLVLSRTASSITTSLWQHCCPLGASQKKHQDLLFILTLPLFWWLISSVSPAENLICSCYVDPSKYEMNRSSTSRFTTMTSPRTSNPRVKSTKLRDAQGFDGISLVSKVGEPVRLETVRYGSLDVIWLYSLSFWGTVCHRNMICPQFFFHQSTAPTAWAPKLWSSVSGKGMNQQLKQGTKQRKSRFFYSCFPTC